MNSRLQSSSEETLLKLLLSHLTNAEIPWRVFSLGVIGRGTNKQEHASFETEGNYSNPTNTHNALNTGLSPEYKTLALLRIITVKLQLRCIGNHGGDTSHRYESAHRQSCTTRLIRIARMPKMSHRCSLIHWLISQAAVEADVVFTDANKFRPLESSSICLLLSVTTCGKYLKFQHHFFF